MTRYDVPRVVRSVVIEAIGIDPQVFGTRMAFGSDLGLASLETLDLFLRIEHCLPLTLSIERCAGYLQGPVPDEEFCDEHGLIRRAGLEHLHTVMPQLDPGAWDGRLHLDQILPMVTVGNVIAMFEALLEQNERLSHE